MSAPTPELTLSSQPHSTTSNLKTYHFADNTATQPTFEDHLVAQEIEIEGFGHPLYGLLHSLNPILPSMLQTHEIKSNF